MGVQIRRQVVQEMIAHARCEYPIECCGLLLGHSGVIDSLQEATNELASRDRFRIPARELFSFFQGIRGDFRQHMGIYHSHPHSAARPSNRDVAEFHYPDVSYWIVSLESEEPSVSCFDWKEACFHEVFYEVVEDLREQ